MRRRDLRGQKAAYRIFHKALHDGVLVRPARCSKCGKSGDVEGHHEDYSRPLDVMWLCPACHHARHDRTNTGYRGRSRCSKCRRLIYRHIIDNGGAREVNGQLAHNKCATLIAKQLGERAVA